ncbi:hypothetical protein EYF80_020253 [Liparis tanakae]|uniref:Uncharacterized protein n=1 Tax=Liparis tanakae TaxID=230148 RepID=A0A4Z2HVB4_9TELE|nr:hypothetical protein EYF80_020253 [Liparis tanakae]
MDPYEANALTVQQNVVPQTFTRPPPPLPLHFPGFLNFSSPLSGPPVRALGRVELAACQAVVLPSGAGSRPARSTAYQPRIQLSVKEGWKDGGIIGRSGSERDQAFRGPTNEGMIESKEGWVLDGKREWREIWLKNGGMK